MNDEKQTARERVGNARAEITGITQGSVKAEIDYMLDAALYIGDAVMALVDWDTLPKEYGTTPPDNWQPQPGESEGG